MSGDDILLYGAAAGVVLFLAGILIALYIESRRNAKEEEKYKHLFSSEKEIPIQDPAGTLLFYSDVGKIHSNIRPKAGKIFKKTTESPSPKKF